MNVKKNRSQYEFKNYLVANGAFQPYRFQLDYVEHDEHEFNDNSTDKDQNNEIVIVKNLYIDHVGI